MFDLFYDNIYNVENVVIRKEKFRVYKCVDKKGNFLWWEWCGDDNIAKTEEGYLLYNPEVVKNFEDYENLDEKFKVEFTSGFADFTKNGDLLELTQEQRDRALVRKVKF